MAKAIIFTNVHLSKVFYGIHLEAILQELHMNLIHKMYLKITLLKLTTIYPRGQWVNEQ